MMSPEWIVLVVLAVLGSMVAFILNFGIVLTDSKSCRQGQKLQYSDLIHLIIGMVNIALQCSVTGQGVLYMFFLPVLLLREVYLPAMCITTSLIYYSYWLSAWLCVYYCMSITNLSHQVFVWLKKTFLAYLPHLLLLSMVACFIISLPTIWAAKVIIQKQALDNISHEPAIISASFSFIFPYIQMATFLGCCLPFLMTLISVVVTVSSLLKHIWKVKQNDSGFGQSKLRAHSNAIKTMILFLTLFIIFYIDVNLFMLDVNTTNPMTIVGWVIFLFFPLAECIIIIQASAKLRRALFGKILGRR